MRKTLEANMHMAHLYPPGRVLWAMRDSDLDPSQRSPCAGQAGKDKLRLFEVQDVYGGCIIAEAKLLELLKMSSLFFSQKSWYSR